MVVIPRFETINYVMQNLLRFTLIYSVFAFILPRSDFIPDSRHSVDRGPFRASRGSKWTKRSPGVCEEYFLPVMAKVCTTLVAKQRKKVLRKSKKRRGHCSAGT